MASALPGDICVGEHSVCIVRAALLDPDCTVTGGDDAGFITTGIVTATASPELLEGRSLEPTTGCGDIAWTYQQRDRIRRFNLTGELIFFDVEMMEILFGGTVIVGDTGTGFAGDNIGWAAPAYTDDPAPAVYLEFITLNAGQGVGDCSDPGDPFAYATGHIFGKVLLTPGDSTFDDQAHTVTFTGKADGNPNLNDGPWNDFPGTGDIPNSPHLFVNYSVAEYDAIADLAGCGYVYVPGAT